MQVNWRKLTHKLSGCISLLQSSNLIRYLFTCVPDVQKGDTQTQRGTRKGTLTLWFMCVKSHNYSYLLKKPFPAHSPHFFFLFFMIYVKKLHFGQAYGGLRFSSNANCSLWLSAHNVILSPTLCVLAVSVGDRGVKSGPKRASLQSLMRPLIRLMRLLWMRWAFHTLPFVLWLLPPLVTCQRQKK